LNSSTSSRGQLRQQKVAETQLGKKDFKSILYYRKQLPKEVNDATIEGIIRGETEEVINEVCQHKLSKIFRQRAVKMITKQEVKSVAEEAL